MTERLIKHVRGGDRCEMTSLPRFGEPTGDISRLTGVHFRRDEFWTHLTDRFDENSLKRNEIRRTTGSIGVAIGQLNSLMVGEGESDGCYVMLLFCMPCPWPFVRDLIDVPKQNEVSFSRFDRRGNAKERIVRILVDVSPCFPLPFPSSANRAH